MIGHRPIGRALIAGALACGLLAGGADAFRGWVARTVLPDLVAETSVEVRDRHGALLRAYTVDDGRWRLAVHRAQIDPRFLEMLVRYEDKRFYQHPGVDPVALVRAAGQSLRAGRVVSGGSTLTMQVARLLEDTGTGRWQGKLRQMRVALRLEQVMSKDEILGLYLLHAPYGGNLEGIRAATLAYFGKEPARLTPAEAALLVALPQAPEARRPDRQPQAARAARIGVLERLERAGLVPAESLRAAANEPFPTGRSAFPQRAPHMADRARAQQPTWTRHDLTLDARLQAQLETLAQQVARRAGRRLSVAMVVADHQTGEVLASVGSAGYGASEGRAGFVDMTQALRSPGSTLKPFVYGLAFDRGLAHPATLIDDRPVSFAGYAPQNFDGQYRGELPVAEALRLSLNTPVVQITEALGPAHLMAALRLSGAQPRLRGEPGLAVSLGGVGLTLEDLVRAYAALARGGQSAPWHWRQGSSRGAETARAVMAPHAAWHVGHILANLPPPPGSAPWRIAYKTGTSYGHRDTWAVGYDGQHVVGIWIGRADGTPVPGAFGAQMAAPVLFAAFERIKPSVAPLPAPPPETLMVGHARLPQPLRHFGTRSKTGRDAPRVAFPPDGAQVALVDGALTVKVRDGQAPFLWFVSGAPVGGRVHTPEQNLTGLGLGWTEVTVIDAAGRSARARIELTE